MPRERLPIGELGSISSRKLASGKWEARGRIRGKDGKPRLIQATATTKAKSVTLLKAKAGEYQAPASTGRLRHQTRLREAAEYWLGTLPESGLKPATLRTYEQVTRLHIIPLLGELSIDEVTTSRVTEFLQQVSKPRPGVEEGELIGGPTPAAHARIALSLIYKLLIHDGVIELSPVTHAKSPKQAPKQVKALSVEEIIGIRKRIMAWGAEKSSGPPRPARLLLDFVDVLAGTGMRPGEVLALRWEDISFATGVIYVHSTLTQVKGVGLVAQPTPKSVYSERGLRMPQFVERVLWARRQQAEPVQGPVFATRNGTYISDSNLRRAWRSARGKEYEHVAFSDYRKAVATLIERAEGMEAAGKALGHSSPEITRRYYVERDAVVDFSPVIDSALALEP